MTEQLWMMNQEEGRRKHSWPVLKYYCSNFLEWLSKTKEKPQTG